jgi:hypothetical protein
MDMKSSRVESVYDTTADLGLDDSLELGVGTYETPGLEGETDDDEL